MHWSDWVQEAWARVARVSDPSFKARCMCGDCYEEWLRQRKRAESYRAPYALDPSLLMSEGLQGSSLNASFLNTFIRDNRQRDVIEAYNQNGDRVL